MFCIRLVLLWSLFSQAVLSSRVSLTDSTAYDKARPCLKTCFGNNDVNYLAQNMKCDENNECVCRQNLQPSAVAYLRRCIGSWCDKMDFDINYGVSLYTAYCTEAGFAAVADATPTAEGTCSPTATITVTAIQTVFVTSAAKRAVMLPLQEFFVARF